VLLGFDRLIFRGTIRQLAHVSGMMAGTRWTVVSCFEAAKDEVGWTSTRCACGPTGWHRHIILAMLTHVYLAVLRQTAVGKKSRPSAAITLALRLDLLPPTIPELRRLLWRLV
jgi:hypothetical protein